MLGTVIDIHDWLDRDQCTSYEQRLSRDRGVVAQLPSDDAARVLAWWRAMGVEQGLGVRVDRARRQAALVLCVAGLLIGWGGGAAAFAYDGGAPINLLVVLGVLVLAPGFLALVSLIAAAARGAGWSTFGDRLSVTAIGRWGLAWIARYAGRHFDLGQNVVSRAGFWQLFVFSQYFALCFFVGVLIVALGMVAFTDLAFGWSSTLRIDAEQVYGWFAVLAAPWAEWWSDAAPSLELVRESRYYRLEGGSVEAQRAAALGGWWPFVLACLLVWGLVPRLVMLIFGRVRLRRALEAYLLGNAEVVALLDRLQAPDVLFTDEHEPENRPPSADVPPPLAVPTGPGTVWVGWNGALDTDSAQAWLASMAAGPVLALGSLDTDAEIAARLTGLKGAERVVVGAKGWEPPTLEFTDFLRLVRDAAGVDCTLVIVPVALAGGVDQASRSLFGDAIKRLGDNRTYVGSPA